MKGESTWLTQQMIFADVVMALVSLIVQDAQEQEQI
jgi:hypothetical protein